MDRDLTIFLLSGAVWFALYIIIALLERRKDRRAGRRAMRHLAERLQQDRELQLR